MKKIITTIIVIGGFFALAYIFNEDTTTPPPKTPELVPSYHQNLTNLQTLETRIQSAIQEKNLEDFDNSIKEFNQEAQEAIDTLIKLDQANQTASLPFISVAQAKERSSWWYHVPVLGHFVKSMHQASETKRAGVYNYLKKEIDSVERDEILKRQNLTSVEDIRDLNDSQIRTLVNSEPELYRIVDWKKMATDVGKAGVNAYVDAVKGATSGSNPISISGTAENVVKDIATDGKIDTVKDQMPKVEIKKGKGTLIGMNKDFQEKLDKIITTNPSKNYQITDEEEQEILKLLQESNETIIFGRELEEETQEINLPKGDWEITLATTNTKPETREIEVKEETVIDPSQFGLSDIGDITVDKKEEKPEETDDNDEFNEEIEDNTVAVERGSNNEIEADGSSLVGSEWKVVDFEVVEIGNMDEKYLDTHMKMRPIYNFIDEKNVILHEEASGSDLEATYSFDGNEGKIYMPGSKTAVYSEISFKNGKLYSKTYSTASEIYWIYGKK